MNGLVSVFATLLTFGSVAWAADWYNAVGLVLYNEQFLAAMLGLVLVMAYLTLPLRRHGTGKLPWYDAAAVPLFPPFLPFFPPSGAPKSCRWWCGNVVEVMGNGYGNGVSNGTARSGTANKVDATIVYGIVGIDGI